MTFPDPATATPPAAMPASPLRAEPREPALRAVLIDGATSAGLIDGAGSAELGHVDGVEIERWRSLDVELPGALLGRPLEAVRRGSASFDTSALARADVLVIRNWFASAASCLSCGMASADEGDLVEHEAATGHAWRRPLGGLVRGLVEAFAADDRLLRGCGLVYELDGDPWAKRLDPVSAPDLDFVQLLLWTADVVVATSSEALAAVRREDSRAEPRLVFVEGAGGAGGAALRTTAWRRAAEQAGIGRLLVAGASDAAVASAASAAADRFAARLELRRADDALAADLAARRVLGLPGWDEADALDPLVTVVLPVVAAPAARIERAIRSALATDGVRIEVVVAGASDPRTMNAIGRCADPRVRFVELAATPGDVIVPGRAWARAAAAAHEAALGTWIAPLETDSEWVPGHVATLLALAIEHGLDLVHGTTLLVRDGEVVGQLGTWPPTPGAIAHDAALVAGRLRAVAPDPDAWIEGETPAGNLWRRYAEIGVRMGGVDEPFALRDLDPPTAADGIGLSGAA